MSQPGELEHLLGRPVDALKIVPTSRLEGTMPRARRTRTGTALRTAGGYQRRTE